MTTMLRRLVCAWLIAVATFDFSSVSAGPSEDGWSAYQSGDYGTALYFWRPLADQGKADIQFNLGIMYEKGQGVTQDYTEAAKWYRKSAEKGNAIAQFNLGLMYAKGDGLVQDYVLAQYWINLAAKLGNPNAVQAYDWVVSKMTPFQIVAATDNAMATGDYVTAASLLRLSAEKGYAYAQNNLGIMYESGQGVSQSYAEAAMWYRKAANQGSSAAQSNLGSSYYSGQGVPQNYVEAAKWYRKSADQGFPGAQSRLGNMYYEGHGVPQDYVQAHVWANLAAAQGNVAAGRLRDLVATKMTPLQVGEAHRLAAEWKPNK